MPSTAWTRWPTVPSPRSSAASSWCCRPAMNRCAGVCSAGSRPSTTDGCAGRHRPCDWSPEVQWMLYGANGYTGRLVLREAVARGLRPVLAGRNAEALAELGREYGLPVRDFPLDDPGVVRSALDGIGLVLHCAGPFSATSAPMLGGCLAAGAH